MLKTARENASQVEITTTGTKLNAANIQELVNIAPDKITITFNYPQHTLDNVLENLKALVKQRKSDTKVILDFIMTKDSIKDLPIFVEQVAVLGVDEVLASNINFVMSPESNSKKVFEGIVSDENRGDLLAQGKAKGKEEYEDLIAQAKKVADKKGVYFTPKKLVCNEAVTCDYNPLKNVFVAWDGAMSPCPYLALKNVKAFFNEKEFDQKPFIVGKVNETNFLDLWNEQNYTDFRGVYDVHH
jgi:MoaA/NifB/PqqE/SkfB family radical SAM enzyme